MGTEDRPNAPRLSDASARDAAPTRLQTRLEALQVAKTMPDAFDTGALLRNAAAIEQWLLAKPEAAGPQ